MIKKISALVIALVLCLSVVVMPVSAAGVELGSNDIAFALEWDKKSYSAGDTAVLSVYMDARDDLSLYTGSFAIGLNSAVINQTDNPIATVKAKATTADWFRKYYKGADTQLSWLSSSVANTHIKDDNTAEENALYDHYLKFTAAKDTAGGSHENTGANNAGFGGDEFIANEPIITISFTIASDVPDSTVVRAAITSGTLTASTLNFTQTKWKYYDNPGSATTTTDIYGTAASGALEQADTTVANGGNNVVIGGATTTPVIINPLKGQMRYGKADGTYDVRALAYISGEDFDDVFKDKATAEGMIKEVGFVFARGASITAPSMDEVKALVEEGTAISGYTKKSVSTISTSIAAGKYTIACTVTGIPESAATSEKLIAAAYIVYEVDGETVYGYISEIQTINFNALYTSTNKPAQA